MKGSEKSSDGGLEPDSLQAMEEAGAAHHEKGLDESHLDLASKDDIIRNLRAQLPTSTTAKRQGGQARSGQPATKRREGPSRAGRSGFV